ncbi:hypothetical protein TSUD_183990 [Trifolium subterraneum]|uniref:Uncharacterized protein n=1 Tax=Trifolium subterraneum TaxID=3900 RepID=A0A2Z6LXM8_TRISU|nr:hypothetical protein TSUD_183990 [Trifolium subterraneum]
MNSSDKTVNCNSSGHEFIEIDKFQDDGVSWEPATDMCFSSADEVNSFYGEYALRKGFGWKIRTSRKGQDGEICYLILACSKERHIVSNVPCTLKTNPTKGKKCPARMCIKMEKDGLWYVTKFDPSHSHECSPTKARLFKANKEINLHVKRTIQMNDDAGVTINKTFQSLVKDAGGGGHENISFCERDVKNYVNKERRAIGKEDVDNEFHVRNVFWADARSRAAYEDFGDVVTFDTTYLTNKYDMPFAVFVGVNHHGQSTLLGCGLVSREDTESFVWLFKSWLRCMVGKAPVGIMTDKCKAMQNAIELVFPTTRHRKHSYIKSIYSAVQLKPRIERFDKLCKHFYNVAEVAAESEVATKALHETLHDFDSNLPTMDDTTGNGKESFNEDSNPNTGTKIRSPVHVNRKGRPQKNRKISILETVCKKPRKKTRTSDNGETATVYVFFL